MIFIKWFDFIKMIFISFSMISVIDDFHSILELMNIY